MLDRQKSREIDRLEIDRLREIERFGIDRSRDWGIDMLLDILRVRDY
jgi:hypothetical protein